MKLTAFTVFGMALLASGTALAEPRTLQEALAAAYANSPTLQAARAQLRSTDEQVPQALAGWRPQVTVSTSVGYADGTFRTTTGVNPNSAASGGAIVERNFRDLYTAQASLTQPLYRGGQTRASTNQADNSVFAQRSRLLGTEQQVFIDTVTAYVNVIAQQQVLQLNINNEQVLQRQLQATNDRFRVGEITRTDVAQAQAALAGASATRQTAEGNLATGRATYLQRVGFDPGGPGDLVEPQPTQIPVKNQAQATQLASTNNPTVIAALFDDAAARDAVDVAFSGLMPQVSLQALAARSDNSSIRGQRTIGAQVLLNASVPIYQGGAQYSRVRQARQQEQQARNVVDEARRQAVQQAANAWETLVAARSTIQSTRAAIQANQVALVGVQREAIVGSRTTLDVLNAEQALLNSRVTLVQNLTNLVTASYTVLAAVGRLTARDLNLNVPLYDETAYYQAVRGQLFGTRAFGVNERR